MALAVGDDVAVDLVRHARPQVHRVGLGEVFLADHVEVVVAADAGRGGVGIAVAAQEGQVELRLRRGGRDRRQLSPRVVEGIAVRILRGRAVGHRRHRVGRVTLHRVVLDDR